MVSVTSEVLANASVQSASARSARPDPNPPAGNDSFAALIDSNANHSDSRAQANAQDNSQAASQAPAPRRADDSQAPTDNRSRDNTSASDNAPRNDSGNGDTTVNARDDAGPAAKTDTPSGKTKDTKSSDAKSDTKSDDAKAKSAGGDSATTDQTAKLDATAAVTADAIAVTIAAPVAPATAPVAPVTDKAAAPLAIAAAAIAASTAVVNATAPGVATADTGTTPAATENTAKADATKTETQTAVGDAVTAQAAAAETPATAGIALAASSSAKLPAGAKEATPVKTGKVVKEVTATTAANATDASAATTGDAAATAPVGTPQTTAKPKAENGIVDAVKGEASGTAAHTANAAAHGHAATADFTQVLANSSGNGLQGAAGIQAQQPSAVATPAAAAQLTVTAATGDAVPLSGVAMEIAASAKSGKTSFEIRLDPADLGRIDVRIDVDRHGQVTSHLTVERPETLSMLRQDATQLQRTLENAGLSTGNGGLQFSLRDQSSQGQNDGNQSNPNAHRLVVSEEDNVSPVVAGRGYGRMLGSSGGVDIRI